MRRLFAFWIKEWLALSRDIHGMAVLFIMPAAFIVIMSLALSDVYSSDGNGRETEFSVLAADNAAFAGDFAQRLSGGGFRAIASPATEAEARERVRSGHPELVLILPNDFERALMPSRTGAGAAARLTLLADPTLQPMPLTAFQQRVLSVVFAQRIAAATGAAGVPLDESLLDPSRSASLAIEVVGNPRAGRPSSVQQNVPAWLIFGMFFVVMPIASLFIVERRDGTLARLASQQVPFSMVLLGKTGPFFIINLAQTVFMLLAGHTLVPWLGGEALALPARWDLLAAVAASTSLAAIAWGLLVAATARTMEQATVIGGVGNVLAAAVGGIMVPRFVMSDAMRAWVDVSPMAWALEGFHAIILRQGGWADILLPCGKLIAFAAMLLAIALLIHRWRRAW